LTADDALAGELRSLTPESFDLEADSLATGRHAQTRLLDLTGALDRLSYLASSGNAAQSQQAIGTFGGPERVNNGDSHPAIRLEIWYIVANPPTLETTKPTVAKCLWRLHLATIGDPWLEGTPERTLFVTTLGFNSSRKTLPHPALRSSRLVRLPIPIQSAKSRAQLSLNLSRFPFGISPSVRAPTGLLMR
jgi:hypothetical protein